MTHETHDKQVDDALGRLRHAFARDVPPIDPARERALLAAFDARWTQPRSHTRRWAWASAVALTAITIALNWLVLTNSSPTDQFAGDDVVDLADFVPWPGAENLPSFESGSLLRVDLPVSALAGLGLSAPLTAVDVVKADIVVGQDGRARAVRLVQ